MKHASSMMPNGVRQFFAFMTAPAVEIVQANSAILSRPCEGEATKSDERSRAGSDQRVADASERVSYRMAVINALPTSADQSTPYLK
jgi:hypothetical protein